MQSPLRKKESDCTVIVLWWHLNVKREKHGCYKWRRNDTRGRMDIMKTICVIAKVACRLPLETVNALAIPDSEADHGDSTIMWIRRLTDERLCWIYGAIRMKEEYVFRIINLLFSVDFQQFECVYAIKPHCVFCCFFRIFETAKAPSCKGRIHNLAN